MSNFPPRKTDRQTDILKGTLKGSGDSFFSFIKDFGWNSLTILKNNSSLIITNTAFNYAALLICYISGLNTTFLFFFGFVVFVLKIFF